MKLYKQFNTTVKKRLALRNLWLITLFILTMPVACGGCFGNKDPLAKLKSDKKGNIADVTADKYQLVGSDKTFTLSFIPKNSNAPINLSKYGLSLETENLGRTSYEIFSEEEQKKNRVQPRGITKFPMAQLFWKAELSVDEIRNNQAKLTFTIIPNDKLGYDFENIEVILTKNPESKIKKEKEVKKFTVKWNEKLSN